MPSFEGHPLTQGDPSLHCFDTDHECDRQMDRQMDRHWLRHAMHSAVVCKKETPRVLCSLQLVSPIKSSIKLNKMKYSHSTEMLSTNRQIPHR